MPISKQIQESSIAALDDSNNFFIEEKVGGPNMLVERTIKIESVPLPETPICTVERIQITEHVIPVPEASRLSAMKGNGKLH